MTMWFHSPPYSSVNKATLTLWPMPPFDKNSNFQSSYFSILQYSPLPTFGLLPIIGPWAYLHIRGGDFFSNALHMSEGEEWMDPLPWRY